MDDTNDTDKTANNTKSLNDAAGMRAFIFESYSFDANSGRASFRYRFDDGRAFEEIVMYQPPTVEYDLAVLDRALFLAFSIIGTSYLKTFPTKNVLFKNRAIDAQQAKFLNKVYGEGLSQFAYENELTRADLPLFTATTDEEPDPVRYLGVGRLVLQSGGKDSLLVARMLQIHQLSFTPWYLGSAEHHPEVLDQLGQQLQTSLRSIDKAALTQAATDGGKNGHVPVTYIVQSLALIQAILLGKRDVFVSIAHEGEEPHATIGNLAVTHQWSKTWEAEQLFASYVTTYVSPNLRVGSPLRRLTELRVAQKFATVAWEKYGHSFSSCNRANYEQGADNSHLQWCGECPKCANSFILFAPFVPAETLMELFAGKDLFAVPTLQDTFKGLFGVDGIMKPFECVGEIDELRYAYHAAQAKGGYQPLNFTVPASSFDGTVEYPSQDWAYLAD